MLLSMELIFLMTMESLLSTRIRTVIEPWNSVTFNVNFLMIDVGNVYSILQVYSDGGAGYTTLTGSADTAPISLLEQPTNEG